MDDLRLVVKRKAGNSVEEEGMIAEMEEADEEYDDLSWLNIAMKETDNKNSKRTQKEKRERGWAVSNKQ